MKVPLILISLLLVCTLIYVGIASIETYQYSSTLPGGYGNNVVYDLSKPLNDIADFINQIGELGQTVMEDVNISNMPSRLYKVTYNVTSNGVSVGNAYIIVYGSLRKGVEQFTSEVPYNPYLYRVFAFKDITTSSPAYNRLNYYINTLGYNYLCTYYDTEYNGTTTRDVVAKGNDQYEYLKTPVINVVNVLNELGINIADFLRYVHVSNAEYVYTYSSADIFDTSEMVNGEYILAQ